MKTIITTTEQGMAISLVSDKTGKARTFAFPLKNVEFVDHLDGEFVTLHFKSGAEKMFTTANGIGSENINKIWETTLDNM